MGALSVQLNLQVGNVNTQSVSPNSTSEILSRTVSSLDLSGARYGTLLLKDKLHNLAYAFATVISREQQLSSLNTHKNNVQSLTDQLVVTEGSGRQWCCWDGPWAAIFGRTHQICRRWYRWHRRKSRLWLMSWSSTLMMQTIWPNRLFVAQTRISRLFLNCGTSR